MKPSRAFVRIARKGCCASPRRDHRRANPRQGRRLEAEGHLDGRSGSPRLPGRRPRPNSRRACRRCRTRRGPPSPVCASAATPSGLIEPTRREDRSIGSSRQRSAKIARCRTLRRRRLAKRRRIGPSAPRAREIVGRRDGEARKSERRRRGFGPAGAGAVRYHRRRSAPASASPSRGPGNGILWAETGGRFQPQNAGERPEFGSQTATRLTNRPELRGFPSTRKPRRFAGTAWWRTQSRRTGLRPFCCQCFFWSGWRPVPRKREGLNVSLINSLCGIVAVAESHFAGS